MTPDCRPGVWQPREAAEACDRRCKPFQCAEQQSKQQMGGDTSPEGAGKEGGRGPQTCVGPRESQPYWLKLPGLGGFCFSWRVFFAVSLDLIVKGRQKTLFVALCTFAPLVGPM